MSIKTDEEIEALIVSENNKHILIPIIVGTSGSCAMLFNNMWAGLFCFGTMLLGTYIAEVFLRQLIRMGEKK